MGCCSSREAASPAHHDGAEDPPVAHLDVSSRNLNAPSSRHTSVPSSRASFLGRSSQPAAASSTNTQPTSSARPNQALTPIPAEHRSTLPNTLASPTAAKGIHRVKPLSDSSSQAWTRQRLEKERRDWWDTRVTGDIQVWRCLQAATEALQEGDVATAQTLLDAQECTCPTGQLWSRIYDDRGNEYRVPEWLVIEPTGIVEEGDSPVAKDTTAIDDSEPDREFVVRVRVSETAADLRVSVRRRETIASIREKLRMQTQMAKEQQFLLVYNGHVYEDTDTLESNGYWNFDNNYFLSCFVRPQQPTSM
ncbi:ubiquitin domain-containing protein [Stagonosporopsis vannaccii]|nr:ubiquitin domain-containing protein [Stagonosporopsis vannaccii]